ncbi:MAG: HAMP domain-containing protein [Spirochaetales bacterium]|nr:HAMP domain-containing protein [Spirochaetales bacterium]
MEINIDRKYCFKISLVYFVACLFANFAGAMIPVTMTFQAFDTQNMLHWKEFLDSHKLLVNICMNLSFVIPIIFCLCYSFSILNTKQEEVVAKKAVNLPIYFSSFGCVGWGVNLLIEIFFLIYAKLTLHINILYLLSSSAVFSFLEMIFTFVVSYLVLETVNRSAFLPRLFPNGNISKIPGIRKFSLNFLFIVFFITICFFPIVFLLSSLIAVQINNGIKIDKDTVIMSILLMMSGFALTIVFMKLFTVPLKILTHTTEKIKNGDYNSKTNVVSNDEMGILSDAFNEMTDSLKEKEFMRNVFGKVVDPRVRNYLLSKDVKLGGETCETTIMFCDIRNFTAMTENMSPEDVVAMLNIYFTEMGKCIEKNHGIINKYIGDAIMAIFGVPIKSENHAFDAYNAALEMRKSLFELNKTLTMKKMSEIKFGIALHSGNVLAGNIGSENRMEYTVIGDVVNTTSRIESLCKVYKTDLLISESVADLLSARQKIKLHFVDEAQIRGKQNSVRLYEPYDI